MARLTTVQVKNNGGGVNDYASPINIGDAEITSQSFNVRGEAETSKPRKGFITYGIDYSSGFVSSMGSYIRNDKANDRLVRVTSDNKIWFNDPTANTTWTEVTQSVLNQSKVNMVSARDWLFMFNGVDRPIRIEGTTVTQPFTKPDTITNANDFLPTVGEEFYGSLFVGGVPSIPTTLFISKASTSGDPEFLYDFSGATSGIGDSNEVSFDSPIVAIRKLTGSLVVFTTTGAIYIGEFQVDSAGVVYWPRTPISGSDGAVSQRTTTVVENDIFYLTPQKEIKSIRRDFSDSISMSTTPISIKIQNFLTQQTSDDLSSAYSTYDPLTKLYKLHLVPRNGVVNYITIVGDIKSMGEDGVPAWYIDYGKSFYHGVFFQGKTYAGSTATGQVYIEEEGLADDDNASIQTQRVSKKYAHGNPKALKKYRGVHIYGEMTPSTTIEVDIIVDDNIVATKTITADQFMTSVTNVGGMGSLPIASYAIGEEATSPDPSTQRFPFHSAITFRATGRTIQVVMRTDNTNQDYRIAYWEYRYITTRSNFYPRKEK